MRTESSGDVRGLTYRVETKGNQMAEHNEPDSYPLGYWDDDDEGREPWCKDLEKHSAAHEFCSDHQAMWCRLCDRRGCPQCEDDPHCPECHCQLFEEYHDWDCSYAGEDDHED